jgi:hypothetical protein
MAITPGHKMAQLEVMSVSLEDCVVSQNLLNCDAFGEDGGHDTSSLLGYRLANGTLLAFGALKLTTGRWS